jgi:hypothetical protein
MLHTTFKSAKSLFGKLLPKATAAGILGCVGMLALAGTAHAGPVLQEIGFYTDGVFSTSPTTPTFPATGTPLATTMTSAGSFSVSFTGTQVPDGTPLPDADENFGNFNASSPTAGASSSALNGTYFYLAIYQTYPTPNNGPAVLVGDLKGTLQYIKKSYSNSGNLQVTFTNTPIAISGPGSLVDTYSISTPTNIGGMTSISGDIAQTGNYNLTPLPSSSIGGLALLVGTGCIGFLRNSFINLIIYYYVYR